MRTSINLITETGTLVDGYDYINQAWVIGGVYMRCGHPDEMNCDCYGKLHEGEPCKVRGDGRSETNSTEEAE